MNATTSTLRNPTLWLVVGIPTATVLASIITVSLAFIGAEPELPARFAREGAPLVLDQQRAARAQQLGIGVVLRVLPSGRIDAQLTGIPSASTPIASLTLRMTHITRPELDRELRLTRGADGIFSAQESAVPAGDWLLELDGGEWRIRGRAVLPTTRVRLGE
ncbi:MAG: hypothetical protein FGM43_05935 [Sinobacteraceae bacterium]|nr:hypothetical protein [Nevskiaceae bacterium]